MLDTKANNAIDGCFRSELREDSYENCALHIIRIQNVEIV